MYWNSLLLLFYANSQKKFLTDLQFMHGTIPGDQNETAFVIVVRLTQLRKYECFA